MPVNLRAHAHAHTCTRTHPRSRNSRAPPGLPPPWQNPHRKASKPKLPRKLPRKPLDTCRVLVYAGFDAGNRQRYTAKETEMFLGDAAAQHAETIRQRETRRMLSAMYRNEPAPRIARHLAAAIEQGLEAQAIKAATDAAIVRHLSTVLGGTDGH